MDLSFTPEQEALRDLAKQIFGARATSDRLRELEHAGDRFDRNLWRDLATAGLLGFGVPEDDGGSGGGIIEVCLLLEAAGRAAAPVPLWPVTVATLALARAGHEQAARVARAEALATHAAGSTNGVADMVPIANEADLILVPQGDDVLIVEPAAIETQEPTGWDAIGRVTFERGEPLRGVSAAWLYQHAAVALCALHVGVAEQAVRLTAEYTSGREQFGRPLGSFQAVQQRAADSYIDVEAMRWTMWQAAWRLSEGMDAAAEVEVAKVWASEGGGRVLAAAQHLHGGIGVDMDYPLHRYTFLSRRIDLTLGGAHEHLARLGALL